MPLVTVALQKVDNFTTFAPTSSYIEIVRRNFNNLLQSSLLVFLVVINVILGLTGEEPLSWRTAIKLLMRIKQMILHSNLV